MSILGRLFKKDQKPEPKDPSDGKTGNSGRKVPATIRVYDAYGRLVEIPREEWRTKILPGNFKQQWANPDALYNLIVDALTGDFLEEALAPARHLAEMEPQSSRGLVLTGVCLLQLKRFDEAKKLFLEGEVRFPEGVLLTNLAKAYSGAGDAALVEPTLVRALELDPNQENGLLWYAAMQRERGGEDAELEALRRFSGLAHAWRPQLWVARKHLATGQLEDALQLYRGVLGKVRPISTEALMQISGDLGNKGYLRELLGLCAPHFDVKLHGLMVGNNLIKAYLETKDVAKAQEILESLHAQKRPDWQQTLNFWDAEVGKALNSYGPVATEQRLALELLLLEGCSWFSGYTGDSPGFPVKSSDRPMIIFYCGTAKKAPAEMPTATTQQPADFIGRLTRGWPMLLAGEVHTRTDVRSGVIIPWVREGGFALAAEPWTLDHLAGAECDYVAFMHIDAGQLPWQVHFSLVRKEDKSQTTWTEELDPTQPGRALRSSLDNMLKRVRALKGVKASDGYASLRLPEDSMLPNFVVALEQALTVMIANKGGVKSSFITAERSILDHLLDLALRQPGNVMLRLLLANTVRSEAKRRPDIVAEYKEKIERLEREHPLAAGYGDVSKAEFAKAFAETARPLN